MLCVPLSLVGVAASKLGPACDGVGFEPFRSSCQKTAQGMNPSNYREKNDFRLTACHSAKSLKSFKSAELICGYATPVYEILFINQLARRSKYLGKMPKIHC